MIPPNVNGWSYTYDVGGARTYVNYGTDKGIISVRIPKLLIRAAFIELDDWSTKMAYRLEDPT